LDAVGTAAGIFGWTGIVALAGLVWTAIGWITYSRLSVRAMFDLEKDTRNYVVLKARDLLVAVIFGVGLLVASALSVASTDLLGTLFELFGFSTDTFWFTAIVRVSALVLVFVIDTLVLAAMFRFLSRAAIRWRRLWGGSALGGLALVGLQVLGSTLAGGVTRNPLLATFAVFVGLLLYFRLTSIVTLVAAAWIAVGAHDRDENLRRVTPAQLDREREAAEYRALLLAAKVRVREARVGLEEAGFFERFPAQRHLRSAEAELATLEARRS
jgi:membrane protein